MTAADYVVAIASITVGFILVIGGGVHLRYFDLVGSLLRQPLKRGTTKLLSLVTGGVEIVVGVAVLLAIVGIIEARWPYIAATIMYGLFAIVMTYRLRSSPGSACGCSRFGRVTRLSTARSVLLLAGALVVAIDPSRGVLDLEANDLVEVIVAGIGTTLVVWMFPDAVEVAALEKRAMS